jgi:hypothetical protein
MNAYARIAAAAQPMEWSIYRTVRTLDSAFRANEDDIYKPDYRAKVKGYRDKLRGGTYELVYERDGIKARGHFEVDGAGFFADPRHLVGTISDMRDATGYWGRYIEGFYKNQYGEIAVNISH